MAKRADDDTFDEWLVSLDHESDDEEEFIEMSLDEWEEGLALLRNAAFLEDGPFRVMSIAINWGKGSSFNLGRIGDTGIRIERYNVGTKEEPQWRFLLADDQQTYMHVDDRTFVDRKGLESAAMEWLINAGRLEWLN